MSAGDAREDDDEAIVLRVRAGGDRAAERELCARVSLRARAFALSRTRDAARAADVSQEVALVVLEGARAGKLDDGAKLGAFALGVAKNVLRGEARGESRRAALLAENAWAFEGVAHMPEAPPDVSRLSRCISSLPLRAQSVLLLTFYAERTGDEIARELSISVGNVRVTRHRALADLRGCMESRS